MPTQRLYYDDPTLLTFTATVVACEPMEDGHRIALEASAFYPTSGGQLHDLGELTSGDARLLVRDVQVDDDGVVWHVADGRFEVGATVVGQVDASRRRDFRQQHSGQHILSASFAVVAGAETVSVHLGLEACTLDLQTEVTAEDCRRAEDHANAVVQDDRPVTVRYADASELASEPRLRRPTTRTGRIRLIDMEDHDLSACGGTHVTRTGEVGAIVITGTERVRGGTRVTFVCGQRVIRRFRDLRASAEGATQLLSVPVAELPAAVSRLRDEVKQAQRRASELIERVAELQLSSLAGSIGPDGVLVAVLEDLDAHALRLVASRLVQDAGRVVALLGAATTEGVDGSPPPRPLVVARSGDRADVDAGAFVRRACEAYGGRGGGKPDLAQAGGVAATADGLRALL